MSTPASVAHSQPGAVTSPRVESPSAHDGAYRVQLDVFEGPFDLLLQLIAGRELEVTDVDLADITGDFIRHLADLDDLDLDTATRFLVVAATLLELKAARLLPTTEGDELDAMLAEARDVLYARLLEYRAVRGAADVLRAALVEGMARHARVVALPGALQRLVPDTVLDLAANDLARLASRALAPKPEQHVEIDHIRRTLLSIHVAAEQVLGAVRKAATTFTAVTEGRSREDRVVLFLAILELAKLGRLHLTQRRWDEPIAIEPGDLDGPELLPTADEAPEPMGSP